MEGPRQVHHAREQRRSPTVARLHLRFAPGPIKVYRFLRLLRQCSAHWRRRPLRGCPGLPPRLLSKRIRWLRSMLLAGVPGLQRAARCGQPPWLRLCGAPGRRSLTALLGGRPWHSIQGELPALNSSRQLTALHRGSLTLTCQRSCDRTLAIWGLDWSTGPAHNLHIVFVLGREQKPADRHGSLVSGEQAREIRSNGVRPDAGTAQATFGIAITRVKLQSKAGEPSTRL